MPHQLHLSVCLQVLLSLQVVSTLAAQDSAGVSGDLLAVYRLTEKASTINDYSQILSTCQSALSDRARSPADQEYARKLLAWAANKRGEARTDQASDLVKNNRLEQARQLDRESSQDFAIAIQHDPSRWRARHNLAIALAMQNKLPQALENFTQVIQQNPKYANAFFNRGEIYFQMKEYRQAIADYDSALQIDPRDPEVHSSRGHAKFMMEKYDEALEDYKRASELAPESVKLMTEYADACQSLYRWPEAADAYSRALKLDGKSKRTLQNAAWLMATCPEVQVRNATGALELAKRSLVAETQNDFRVWDTLAAAQAATGDFGRALGSAQQALKLAPSDERAEVEMRARLYEQRRAYVQPVGDPLDRSSQKAAAVGTGIRK